MTYEEAIKALECCRDAIHNVASCKECPYYEKENCSFISANDILDFMKRQQAEIEKLKDGCSNCCELRVKSETISELNEQIEYWQRGYNDLLQENKTIKSEAVKEFAERLKNEIINDTAFACDSSQHTGYYDYKIKIGEIPEYIDSIVKVMVGDEE